MKFKQFTVPIYKCKVRIIELEKGDDEKLLRKRLSWVFPLKDREEMIEAFNDKSFNGGWTNRDGFRKFTIILLPVTSEMERLEILGHEKRHLEDRILEHLSINDIEASAYLAGYLTQKIFIQNCGR